MKELADKIEVVNLNVSELNTSTGEEISLLRDELRIKVKKIDALGDDVAKFEQSALEEIGLLKEQSHEIVRLSNSTICEKSCGCKTSLQFYLRFVGVVFAYLRSKIGSN